MNRLAELKAYYKYERGDKPVSKKFQRVYNIIVPLFVSAIFGIIIFFIVNAVLLALAILSPKYSLIITIVLASLLPISMFKNQLYDESWKNAILVKSANGGYDFRFRKDSKMVAAWTNMAMEYVDKDGDGKAEDALRALNEESIICKVCSKEFDPKTGTKEFEFQICGKTKDCKNELWKLG